MNGIDLESIITILPAIIIGLTFHEYAHAKVGHLLGDDTAFLEGRVSLNPLKHIDWFGLLFIIIAHFGWAKPVHFNPEKLKNPRRDEKLIAIAGPIANVIMAILFALILKLWTSFEINPDNPMIKYAFEINMYCIFLNYGLFVFNMIPIPPLDGSHLILKSINISKEMEANIIKYGAIGLFAIIIIDSQTKLNILPIGKAIQFLTFQTLHILQVGGY